MKTRTKAHQVTFLNPTDIEAVVLAQLGRSNACIMATTGLSNSQINYRLKKAKTAEGYKKYHTYRSEWRSGSGALARQIETQFLPKARTSASRRLPGLFEHRTPAIVNV